MVFNFTNQMRDETLAKLFQYVQGKRINLLFFNLDDGEFFARFADGVPLYSTQGKMIANKYSLVHFDGPHTRDDVWREVSFFLEGRLAPGACLCFDDIGNYDHERIEHLLYAHGFKAIRKVGRKAAYKLSESRDAARC